MENNETTTQATNETTSLVEANSTSNELSLLQSGAKFMDDGGIFMWIILCIWLIGVAIAIERVKSLFKADVDSASLMDVIKKSVITNTVQDAITKCNSSAALLASVMKNGLKRANQSKEMIQDALEASMLEALPMVEKRLNYLALIANVSTLIGLLGTIYGLIQSFAAVAAADPATKSELLALGISKAMNTTAFGLISAISIMVIHSILSSKAEKIIADIEQCSVKLLDLLSNRKSVPVSSAKNANGPELATVS